LREIVRERDEKQRFDSFVARLEESAVRDERL
jgi:hypothetical protein